MGAQARSQRSTGVSWVQLRSLWPHLGVLPPQPRTHAVLPRPCACMQRPEHECSVKTCCEHAVPFGFPHSAQQLACARCSNARLVAPHMREQPLTPQAPVEQAQPCIRVDSFNRLYTCTLLCPTPHPYKAEHPGKFACKFADALCVQSAPLRHAPPHVGKADTSLPSAHMLCRPLFPPLSVMPRDGQAHQSRRESRWVWAHWLCHPGRAPAQLPHCHPAHHLHARKDALTQTHELCVP